MILFQFLLVWYICLIYLNIMVLLDCYWVIEAIHFLKKVITFRLWLSFDDLRQNLFEFSCTNIILVQPRIIIFLFLTIIIIISQLFCLINLLIILLLISSKVNLIQFISFSIYRLTHISLFVRALLDDHWLNTAECFHESLSV